MTAAAIREHFVDGHPATRTINTGSRWNTALLPEVGNGALSQILRRDPRFKRRHIGTGGKKGGTADRVECTAIKEGGE